MTLGAQPAAGEGMAAGDVVNTTARLQSAAPVNGVLVGETTYRATRNVIEYEDAAPVDAKGKTEPIRVWQAKESRARVRTEPVSTSVPVVGREREVALLCETLVRVRTDSAPQLVTLVGLPGIGKSRLVRELLGFVEQGGVLTFWRQGRSLPYGEGVTFSALTEIVKAQAGILETDDESETEAKLRSALANLVPDEAEASRLERYLRPLVGLAGDDELQGVSPSEAFAAWRQLFEAMAEQRPLVLVFEDIQWADDGLLDFVDHLIDWSARLPILVVCTARPELLERRQGWGGGKLNATTLSLSPLSDEDTARLFAAVLGTPVLESERQRELLAHAGGNPLYAEQFARMVADEPEAGTMRVPETIHGIISARVDRLPAAEKELLQDAAVLGKIFWLGGLVDGRAREDVDQLLHSLERKEFVQRARRTSVSNEPEYAFLHVLVRDVAYGQIPRADRAAKHRRAAEWIESLGRAEDHAELLAHHYAHALELGRAAGADVGALAERARASFRAAGERATALNAYAAAVRFYDDGLSLCPEDQLEERAELLLGLGRALHFAGDERQYETLEATRAALLGVGDPDRAAETDALQAQSWWIQGRHDRASEHLRRAEDLVDNRPSSASKARVLSEVSRFHLVGGRYAEAIRVGEAAIAIAEELGLEDVRAAVLVSVGTAQANAGDTAGIGTLETAVELTDRLNLPQVSWRAMNNLGITLVHLRGDVERATELATEALHRAERLGDRLQITWFHSILARDLLWLGRFDEALRVADLMVQEVREMRHYTESIPYEVRAIIRLARDDGSGAVSDAEQAVRLVRRIPDLQALIPTLSSMAFVFVSVGRRDDASAITDELLGIIRSERGASSTFFAFVPLSLAAVELGRAAEFLEVTADIKKATRWLSAGRAYALGEVERAAELLTGLSVPDAAWVRLRAAERLVSEGRRAEADDQLAKALAFYRSVGATRYIRDGEALLAATA